MEQFSQSKFTIQLARRFLSIDLAGFYLKPMIEKDMHEDNFAAKISSQGKFQISE